MVIQMWQQSMAQEMPLSCLQQGKRAAGTTSRMSPSVIHLGKALPPAHILLYAVIIRLQCKLTALHRQSIHIPKMKTAAQKPITICWMLKPRLLTCHPMTCLLFYV